MLDKVILRWRRKGVGLKGFRQDVESGEDSEDEDILRVFRKQKVDGAVNEAFSRVMSMTRTLEARQQYHRVLTTYCKKKVTCKIGEVSICLRCFLSESSFVSFVF